MRSLKRTVFVIFLFFTNFLYANNETDTQIKKTHIEDIFIWKISDELKLTVQQEKQFSDINKKLNKQKTDLNKKIQDSIQSLNKKTTDAELMAHRKLLQEYSNISIKEFDLIKNLLGREKFVAYLKIKNDLTSKVKSLIIGEKNQDKKDQAKKLPPPKIIVEKND